MFSDRSYIWGMIHTKIHLIYPGCSWSRIALQWRFVVSSTIHENNTYVHTYLTSFSVHVYQNSVHVHQYSVHVHRYSVHVHLQTTDMSRLPSVCFPAGEFAAACWSCAAVWTLNALGNDAVGTTEHTLKPPAGQS